MEMGDLESLLSANVAVMVILNCLTCPSREWRFKIRLITNEWHDVSFRRVTNSSSRGEAREGAGMGSGEWIQMWNAIDVILVIPFYYDLGQLANRFLNKISSRRLWNANVP